jgi:hypothetical protein
MRNSIIIRFGVAAVLISAGCVLMWAGLYRGVLLFCVATIFFMPRSELTQPIPHRELLIEWGVLFALFAAIVAAKHFLPSSAADTVLRVICHPAFVLSLWLFMMWGLLRHYQRQKGGVDA